MLFDVYISLTKKIGFLIFGLVGYLSTDLLNVIYYGSFRRYIYVKIRNTIILSVVGYYLFPYILPIYIYFYI